MLNGVVTRLKDTAAVTGWVGDRIYEVAEGRQANFPFIRCTIITGDADDDKGGASDLDIYIVQVDAFSEKSAAEARQIAGAARTSLERYSGTSDSVAIQSIQYLDQATLHNFNGSYPGEFMHSMDYKVRVTT